MSRSMDGWSELRLMGWPVLLAAFALGCGMTLATAQQGQEVTTTTPATAGTGGESSWVKICTADEETGNKQFCLVRHEGLETKTGAILISVAVRTIEGEEETPARQRTDGLFAGHAGRGSDQDRRGRTNTVAVCRLLSDQLSAANGAVEGNPRQDAEGQADDRRRHERGAENDGLPACAQRFQQVLRWTRWTTSHTKGKGSDDAGVPRAPDRTCQEGTEARIRQQVALSLSPKARWCSRPCPMPRSRRHLNKRGP